MASVKSLACSILSKSKVFEKYRSKFCPLSSLSTIASSDTSFRFSDMQIKVASMAEQNKIPDSSTLVFGEAFSNHMFEANWRLGSGWQTPRIVPLHFLPFHPGSKVFHYAQAVFEGMKAFKHVDGSVSLFRPDLNVKRLLESAARACLPTFDGEEFLKCLKKLISVDKDWVPCIAGSSLYIRPVFIGTQSSLGVISSDTALLYVVTCPVGPYFRTGAMEPVSLLADPSYVRAWPGGVGNKKMACNYAPTLYVQKLAQEQGLQQVLWLFGEDHRVAEGGAMNVFFLFSKGSNGCELATPTLDGTILPGVTRQSLLDLARGLGDIEVSERTITMSEILEAVEKKTLLEMFLCGTAASVCPVKRIRYLEQDITIPTMERKNPLFQQLYKTLTDIQYGRVESEWTVRID